MKKPHRIEHDDAEQSPLDRNIERLVMRISDALPPGSLFAGGRVVEQLLRRAGAMSERGRFADPAKRLRPICETLPGRGWAVFVLILLVFDCDVLDAAA